MLIGRTQICLEWEVTLVDFPSPLQTQTDASVIGRLHHVWLCLKQYTVYGLLHDLLPLPISLDKR